MKHAAHPPDLFPSGKDAEQKILSLAPLAVREAERILRNPKASAAAQIQVIDLILSRTCGRPKAVLKQETGGSTEAETNERLQAMIEGIRKKKEASV